MKGKEYVPFQYYATTGEADDEPSQLESESSNTTWDQKMEEVHSNQQKLVVLCLGLGRAGAGSGALNQFSGEWENCGVWSAHQHRQQR